MEIMIKMMMMKIMKIMKMKIKNTLNFEIIKRSVIIYNK